MTIPAIPERTQLEVRRLGESTSRGLSEEQDTFLFAELVREESLLGVEDDEDAPRFCSETLLRAKTFLLAQSKQFRKICGYFPPAPRIGPGPS